MGRPRIVFSEWENLAPCHLFYYIVSWSIQGGILVDFSIEKSSDPGYTVIFRSLARIVGIGVRSRTGARWQDQQRRIRKISKEEIQRVTVDSPCLSSDNESEQSFNLDDMACIYNSEVWHSSHGAGSYLHVNWEWNMFDSIKMLVEVLTSSYQNWN